MELLACSSAALLCVSSESEAQTASTLKPLEKEKPADVSWSSGMSLTVLQTAQGLKPSGEQMLSSSCSDGRWFVDGGGVSTFKCTGVWGAQGKDNKRSGVGGEMFETQVPAGAAWPPICCPHSCPGTA